MVENNNKIISSTTPVTRETDFYTVSLRITIYKRHIDTVCMTSIETVNNDYKKILYHSRYEKEHKQPYSLG